MAYNPIQQMKNLVNFIFPKLQPSRLEVISQARMGTRRGYEENKPLLNYSAGIRQAHFYNPNH